MVALGRTVIITTAPILGPIVKGGAQRVLRNTYRALRSLSHDCVVLQRDDQGAMQGVRWVSCRMVKNGEVNSQLLSEQEMAALLRVADLTLSVDMALHDLPRGRWHVLVLSNLAYDAERAAVCWENWDRVWVPSHFLRDQLIGSFSVSIDKIDIVPPVLELRSQCPNEEVTALGLSLDREEIPIDHRLLFPHRSDPAKGILDAISLLRRLVLDDERWRLIVTAPSKFDDPTNHSFFSESVLTVAIRRYMCVIPWLPHEAMSQLYRISGCTLMASKLPESFGLVATESVWCGTPVVALEAGGLAPRYCELPAISFVDRFDCSSTVQLVREIAGTPISPEVSSRLQTQFSHEAHVEAVRCAIALLKEEP